MKKNKIKQMVKEGKNVIGCFSVTNSQANIEVLAAAGYDFVVIDTEHFMMNPETIEHMVTACESAGIASLVRVQENVDLICRALDCGADGIIVPHVNTREEAELIVETAKYLPQGKRGVCNPRAVLYGVNGIESMQEYYKEANEETMVICQIETKTGVENMEEIVKVEGIDSLFVGPMDLSNTLGIVGQFDHPELKKYIDKALQIGKENNMPMSIMTFNGESTNEFLEKGFQIIAMGCDAIFLMQTATDEMKKVR